MNEKRLLLLADIKEVFEENEAAIFSKELITRLAKLEDRPWGNWYGRSITQTDISKLLRDFGNRSKTVRICDETAKGYKRKQFEDDWKRYLPQEVPPSSRYSRHLVENKGVVTENLPSHIPKCDGQKTIVSDRKQRIVAGVTGNQGVTGGEDYPPHPSKFCPLCSGSQWWRSAHHDRPICARCHPPAHPGVVAEWIKV